MNSLAGFKNKLNQPIDLQPVQIDIDFSNKVPLHVSPFQIHLRTPSILSLARKYDDILNSSIEQVITCLCDKQKITVTLVNTLTSINKANISFHSIINLRVIQKLTYLLSKCTSPADQAILRKEIEYWKGFLLFALTDMSNQEIIYDNFNRKHRRNQMAWKKKQDDLLSENNPQTIILNENQDILENLEVQFLSNRQSSKKKNSQNLIVHEIS